MANAMYDLGRAAFGNAGIAFTSDNIKSVLTDHGGATPNVATSQYLSNISAGTISTSGNMTGKTNTAGVLDCDDFSFTAVSGASCESLNFYKDTGVASSSPLFLYIDTATGLPVTPGGGNISVVIDSGANKLMKL